MEERDKRNNGKRAVLVIIILLFLMSITGCVSLFSFFNSKDVQKEENLEGQEPLSDYGVEMEEIQDNAVEKKYKITVIAPLHGGEITVKTDMALPGETITVLDIPAAGFILDRVITDGKDIATNVFVMPCNDVEVTAVFVPLNLNTEAEASSYSIKKGESINGIFMISKASAKSGEVILIETTPDVGYEVDEIFINDKSLEKGVSKFNMPPAAVTVVVTFKKLVYGVDVVPAANGEIRFDRTNASIGDVIILEIVPDTGYKLDAISAKHGTIIDNEVENNGIAAYAAILDEGVIPTHGEVCNVSVMADGTGDVEIAVTYKASAWTVTKEIAENGSVEVDKTSATIGDVIKVTATPDIGYTLDTITATNATVDGNVITADGTGNIDITVTFRALIWNVTQIAAENGRFHTDKFTASVGETITVTATPDNFCMVDKITATNATVNGNKVVSDGTGDIEITVTFAPKAGYCLVTYNSNSLANISGQTFVPHNSVLNVDFLVHNIPDTYLKCLRDENGNDFSTSFNVGSNNIITLSPVVCKTQLVRVFNNGGISDVGGFWIDDQYSIKGGKVTSSEISVLASGMQYTYMVRVHSKNRVDISQMIYEQVSASATNFWCNRTGQNNLTGLQPFNYTSVVVNSARGIRMVTSPITGTGTPTSAVSCITTIDNAWRSLWNWDFWKKTNIEVTEKLKQAAIDIAKLPTENGSFSVQSKAIAEEKVVITVSPDAGYSLEYIKVNGDIIVGNTFVMPNKKAVVEVMFKKIE